MRLSFIVHSCLVFSILDCSVLCRANKRIHCDISRKQTSKAHSSPIVIISSLTRGFSRIRRLDISYFDLCAILLGHKILTRTGAVSLCAQKYHILWLFGMGNIS